MMSTATETKLDVEISITETAPCTKRIALSVPASAIDQRLEFALSAFLRDASIPGFRKGKAPRALVEKRVGTALIRLAESHIAQSGHRIVVLESSLNAVGFYLRLGYAPAGAQRSFGAIAMCKQVAGRPLLSS